MAKIGKISPILKDVSSAFPTMDKSLRERGYTRAPGTVRIIFPYREGNLRWRTGLDPEAPYIKRMKQTNPQAADAEKARVIALKAKLEEALDVPDLGPTSAFWKTVQPVSIKDGDNIFNLDDAYQELTFSWLRVHPQIAPSLRAWEAGEVDSSINLYVKDDNAEAAVEYRKSKTINDAIVKFTSYSNEKRMKIVRLMGFPVSGEETEDIIYTQFDKAIRASEMNYGPYKGSTPVLIFERFSTIPDDQVDVYNLVELALRANIYRFGTGGRIYQGETVIYNSKEDMQNFYLDVKNQDQLLLLKQQVNTKKEQLV